MNRSELLTERSRSGHPKSKDTEISQSGETEQTAVCRVEVLPFVEGEMAFGGWNFAGTTDPDAKRFKTGHDSWKHMRFHMTSSQKAVSIDQ